MRSNRDARGQSIVELALVLPLLLLFLLLTADVARALSAWIEIGNMAREGAHYGSLGSANAADARGIEAAALAEGGAIFGTTPAVTSLVDVDPYGFRRVRVTVTYTFRPLVTFPPIPASLTLERSAAMRVLGS